MFVVIVSISYFHSNAKGYILKLMNQYLPDNMSNREMYLLAWSAEAKEAYNINIMCHHVFLTVHFLLSFKMSYLYSR